MSFAILGMGTALPPTTVSQDDALALAGAVCCRTREQETWLPPMFQGTGIQTRHSVMPRSLVDDIIAGVSTSQSVWLPTGDPADRGPTTEERLQVYRKDAPILAADAARAALSDAALPAAELTHLVTVSCTGFNAPGVDCGLIRELDLAPTIERTHIGFMGCHGALNGLRVARAFTGSDPKARVLLVAVELCSLHYSYGWDPGCMVANALFADGAAALVGAPADAASSNDWQAVASGSRVFPGTADAMTWSIGNHGFVMTLSKQLPGLIARHLRPWLEEWLLAQGLTIADIRSWAIHPGGPRILSAASEALGLSVEQTREAREIFALHGNMSSPTVLFILQRMRRENAQRPCVAMGFGPGLTVEAALLV